MAILQLIGLLVLIVIAAEVFTNALEAIGERMQLSTGVTGSLFAAVGTAMPESLIPVLAIVAGTDDPRVNEEISVGAILGAPLMLSTLALCLIGLVAIRSRGLHGTIAPEATGTHRDLTMFLISFGLATGALFLPLRAGYLSVLHVAISGALIVLYFLYVMMTVRASARLHANGHATIALRKLFITHMGIPGTLAVGVIQAVLGLVMLVFAAHGFVDAVKLVSDQFQVSALLLAILLVPVATELPEKVNSISWILKRQDTLAIGNITGAMMFQGSVLPALGLLLTPWAPNPAMVAGIVVTFAGAIWIKLLMMRGRFKPAALFVNGALYVAYLIVVLRS